ncbi:phosphate/phosphite/phosphonate ABC transporter substrate-binding protein [Thermodesulfobacteriota bacterium B35]
MKQATGSRPGWRSGLAGACCGTVVLLLAMTTCVLAASAQGDLKLGVVPYKSPRSIVRLYSPLAALLSRALDRNVRVVTTNSFNEYLQRIYRRQYDIIALGSTFYFKAHDRAGYQAVARGYPSFRCGIIVRRDSGITEVGQLRGRRMAAVDIMDRGGYKLQVRALKACGIDPDSDIIFHFRGRHDSVIYSVLSGQDDAGAIRLDALRRREFDNVLDRLRIIYTSPENPQFPFAVRPDMAPELKEKIGAVLAGITMARPETAAILKRLHIQGIERISDIEMEELRRSRQAEETGM